MKRKDIIDNQDDSDEDEQRSRNRKASSSCPLDYCDEAKAKDAVHFPSVITRPEDPNAQRPRSAGGRLYDPVVDISTTRLPSMRNRSTSLIEHSTIHIHALENKDKSTVTLQSHNLNRRMSGTEFISFGQSGIVTAPFGESNHKRQHSSTVEFKPVSVSGRSTHFYSPEVKRIEFNTNRNQLPGTSNAAQLNQARLGPSKTQAAPSAVFLTGKLPSPFTWALQPSKTTKENVNVPDTATAPVNSSRTFTTQTKLRSKKRTAYEVKPDHTGAVPAAPPKAVIHLTGVSSVATSVDAAPSGPESVWVVPANAAGLLEIVSSAIGAPNIITNDATASEQSEIVISVPVSVARISAPGPGQPSALQPMNVVYQEGLVNAGLIPNELQPIENVTLSKLRPQDFHPSEVIHKSDNSIFSTNPEASMIAKPSVASAAISANASVLNKSLSVGTSPQPSVNIFTISPSVPNISRITSDLVSLKPSETVTLEIIENITYPGVGQLGNQLGSAVSSNATVSSAVVKSASNLSSSIASPVVKITTPATTGQVSNKASGLLSPHKKGDPNVPIAAEITKLLSGAVNVKVLQAQSVAGGGQTSNLPPGQINLEIIQATIQPGASETTGAITRHTIPLIAEMDKSPSGTITIKLREVPDPARSGQAAGTSQSSRGRDVVVVTPEMDLAEIISQITVKMGTAAAADTAAAVGKTGTTDMRNPHVGDHKSPRSGEVRDLQSVSAPVSGEQSIHQVSKTVDGRNLYRMGEVHSEPINRQAENVTSEGIPSYPQGSASFTPSGNLTPVSIEGSLKSGRASDSVTPEEQSLESSGQVDKAHVEAKSAPSRGQVKRTGFAKVVSTVLLAMGLGGTVAGSTAVAGKGTMSSTPSGGAPAMPEAMSITGSGRIVPSRNVLDTVSVGSSAFTPRTAGKVSAQSSIFSGTSEAASRGGISPSVSPHSVTTVNLTPTEQAPANVPIQQGVSINPMILKPVASSIGAGYRSTIKATTSKGTPLAPADAEAEGSNLNDREDNVEQVERQIGNIEDVEYKSSIADVLNIVSAGLANMMTSSSFVPTQEQTAVVGPEMHATAAMAEQRFTNGSVKKSLFEKLVSKIKGKPK